MVKADKQLQIRLTEPVIFLRGPSTGLDHRGRPVVISADAQPAQLRGLLTLRLSKPTRIRKIEIKLDGKSRTEWPEGIGPRHMETYEEKVIIHEKTTYFNAIDGSNSRSRSNRRAASLGPGGVDPSQWDLPDTEDDQPPSPGTADILGSHRQYDGSEGVNDEFIPRGRGRTMPRRSASALPGTHDSSSWHRDGFSRRPSFDTEDGHTDDEDSGAINRGMGRLRIGANEPSPAYTPEPESRNASVVSLRPGRPSPGRRHSPLPSSREPGLSPIISAAPSRAASDRDGSSSTERRTTKPTQQTPRLPPGPSEDGEDENIDLGEEQVNEEDGDNSSASNQIQPESSLSSSPIETVPPSQSILNYPSDHPHHHPRGTVCFADRVNQQSTPVDPSEQREESSSEQPRPLPVASNRAASIRSLASHNTESSTSLNQIVEDGNGGEISETATNFHPVHDAVRSIRNTPTHSAAASVRSRPSYDNLAPDHVEHNTASPSPLLAEQSSRPGPSSLPLESPESILSEHSDPLVSVPQTKTVPGHHSRLGAPTTLTYKHGPSLGHPTRPPLTSHGSSERSGRSVSFHRSASGQNSARAMTPDGVRSDSRDHRHSRFSISAALDAVKERVASKSRSRQSSRAASRSQSTASMSGLFHGVDGHDGVKGSRSRVGSMTGDGIPPVPTRGRSGTPVSGGPDFHEPFGRGGAARRNSHSRDRTISPGPAGGRDNGKGKGVDRDKSPHHGRGRHKGMKVLTDALGLGDHHHHQTEGEDVHNWREFRKGTYNYPISFTIPVDTPPTLHSEFGSVTYRLKASVIRVGALTTNLVEDMEVTMIASPQDDDLEEHENVIVERQWEDQLRYQLTINGKAFPIGGIIPLGIRLLPLLKCKIHRLSVILEEKTDYYAHNKRITRHEQPKKFILMFIKQPDKGGQPATLPLLPILSEDPNAAKGSPLAPLAAQAALNNPPADTVDPNNEDWQFAQLMDPMGPWHFEKNLQIPDCASLLKVTSKHEKTNMSISHWLKVTIRVERGDDKALDAKGRRKQFDIIIDTPIKILDCRVNPTYNSLPSYAYYDPNAAVPGSHVCSIHGAGGKHGAYSTPRVPLSSGGPDTLVSTAATQALHPGRPSSSRDRSATPSGNASRQGKNRQGDTLLERNIVYDRLMSGQETAEGEIPPTYGEAVANAIRSARSASRSASARPRDRSIDVPPIEGEGQSSI